MVDVKRDVGIPVMVGVTTGITLFWVQKRLGVNTFALSTLIDPASVEQEAEALPSGHDDFILSAWDLVANDIRYSGYGSILHFVNSHVKCQRCLVPEQVLDKGVANCVGMSALMVSILRNRIPAPDVYMALGEYRGNPPGGHAWVIVRRGGSWYLIEATSAPPEQPWVTADYLSEIYVPHAWVNDEGLVCYNPDVCRLDFSISRRPRPRPAWCSCLTD